MPYSQNQRIPPLLPYIKKTLSNNSEWNMLEEEQVEGKNVEKDLWGTTRTGNLKLRVSQPQI